MPYCKKTENYSITSTSYEIKKFFFYIVSGCTSGNIRLHEGTYQYEGQLQICTNGVWEGVLSSNWDYFDAEVACRQLWLFQVASTS